MANAYTLVGGLGGVSYEGDNPIIPTTSDIVIEDGTIFDANLVIKGDSNLIASNIKSNATIFGITGTSKPVEFTSGYAGVAYIGTSLSNYIRYNIKSITYK